MDQSNMAAGGSAALRGITTNLVEGRLIPRNRITSSINPHIKQTTRTARRDRCQSQFMFSFLSLEFLKISSTCKLYNCTSIFINKKYRKLRYSTTLALSGAVSLQLSCFNRHVHNVYDVSELCLRHRSARQLSAVVTPDMTSDCPTSDSELLCSTIICTVM